MGHEVGHFETPTGRWWLPLIDDIVATTMRRGLIFESEVVAEASKHIVPGSTVLDLGSNFGQMALLFSRKTGPSGVVHAFEADPFVCHLLRLNVEANAATNIVVHETAVWRESGQTLFYPVPDLVRFSAFGSYGIDPKATGGRTVTSTAIDSLDLPSNISFMKIDVQGSDLFAMEGAVRTIKRNKMPILFEFETSLQNDFGTSFGDYEALIATLQYRIEKVIGGYNYLIKPTQPFK
jgi:FkbM family methyltransferase